MSALSGLANSTVGTSPNGLLSVTGLASGLDTNKIVQGLLAVQQQQITDLQNKQNTFTQEETAFKGVEARLLALQGKINVLDKSQNGVFDVQNVTSSNTNLVTAAADSTALPGIYTLQVNSLAKVNEIASEGYNSPTSLITQGTFQIGTQSGASATLTIDSSNNTLQGLANAINSAGVGVTASVINDGSASQSYRLLLTSNQTGVKNAISITNNLAADNNGAIKPVFNASYVGAVSLGSGYTGTSTPTSNQGAGNFTGSSNNTYTFTVTNGGTVGTDNNIQLSYTDSTGSNTGTITLNASDVNTLKSVAQGIQVQFSAGTLVAGQTFTIKGYVPTVQQAADASVTVGSGSGALTVTNSTNQIQGLFNGITVNLVGADPTQTVSLTVSSDTTQASQAVQDFVSAFNDLMTFIDQQVQYDPSTNTSGPLLGDQRVIDIQNQVRDLATEPVAGVNPLMNTLSDLGISVDDQGHLQLDTNKLNQALTGQISGVSLKDISNLFTLSGVSSNPGIQFVAGTDQTQASTTPYQVSVTQAAQQATMSATNALAGSTVVTNSNNTFTITVDGVTSSTITLAAGTYTPQQLAQEVQSAINGNSNLVGRQVSVALQGNNLAITSGSYGASSQVAIGTGTALGILGFTGSESGNGKDVAGTYLVNNVSEPAVGAGQVLTGQSGNAHTSGLETLVTLSQPQVGSGITANLTVSRGIASEIGVTLNSLLDPVTGRLQTIQQGFQDQIDNVQKEITRQNQLLQQQQNSLLNQFVTMEQTVSQLQGVGNYIATQFSQLLPIGSAFSSQTSKP